MGKLKEVFGDFGDSVERVSNGVLGGFIAGAFGGATLAILRGTTTPATGYNPHGPSSVGAAEGGASIGMYASNSGVNTAVLSLLFFGIREAMSPPDNDGMEKEARLLKEFPADLVSWNRHMEDSFLSGCCAGGLAFTAFLGPRFKVLGGMLGSGVVGMCIGRIEMGFVNTKARMVKEIKHSRQSPDYDPNSRANIYTNPKDFRGDTGASTRGTIAPVLREDGQLRTMADANRQTAEEGDVSAKMLPSWFPIKYVTDDDIRKRLEKDRARQNQAKKELTVPE